MPYEVWNRLPGNILGSTQRYRQGSDGAYSDTLPLSLEQRMRLRHKYLMDSYDKEDEDSQYRGSNSEREVLFNAILSRLNQRNNNAKAFMHNLEGQGYQYTPETELSNLFYSKAYKRGM